MGLLDFTKNPSNKNVIVAGSCAVAVLVVGFALISTRAAGTFLSIEPEAGTMTGGAAQGADAQASGGKYAQFAAPVVVTPPPSASSDLNDAKKKETAMMLVSTAENSSLDWRQQYGYIEYNVEGNASENRGYTAGIIGFTSKTHDMLELVKYYQTIAPGNVLAKYITALQNVDGTSSQSGLGAAFERDWKTAAADVKFRQAQDRERDRVYFNVAVTMAKNDKVRALGQFAYYDAAVMHGPDDWGGGLVNIRAAALKKAKTPAQGGDEKTWLNAFLDAREAEMRREEGHADTTRVSTAQRKFLNEGNYDLSLPLSWGVYGDPFSLSQASLDKYLSTGKF
jgi:chitosanase